MMEEWYLRTKKADFNAIALKYGISPILARLIRNRDVISDEEIDLYLNGTKKDLYDGMMMADMNRAVRIISDKIKKKLPIRVIGDYDIDGVNAAYILQNGIANLGGSVDTDIPDRVKDGFGLSQRLIDGALSDGIDTVITCDNGIAARDEIALGKERGLTIIVTDHHEVPFIEEAGERRYILPPADAVVDPQRRDCGYPFKKLCGAAVAYKLVEALYRFSKRDTDEIGHFIENVGMATVGDVMDLKGENRIFVKEGLKRLANTKNHGLRALIECTMQQPDRISAYHIGFILGPCINAGGRLDTAKKSLALLNAPDEESATALASELKSLNDRRKEMTEKGVQEAVDIIESSLKDDRVLVVYLPDSHESIAGIIAGRVREKYYRPVFILTDGENYVKGSGRSIDKYNMYEEISKFPELFLKFGGHKSAAGLSMKKENIRTFREKINASAPLSDEDLRKKVLIDMRLPFFYITENLIRELKEIEPCGQGNPKPIFAQSGVTVAYPKIVGRHREVLTFTAIDGGVPMEAIYFGDARECFDYIQSHEKMSFTFYPDVREYKGVKSLRIVIVNYR